MYSYKIHLFSYNYQNLPVSTSAAAAGSCDETIKTNTNLNAIILNCDIVIICTYYTNPLIEMADWYDLIGDPIKNIT